MAIQTGGYMGGFSGRLGTAVGYMWNGKWCLRARPGQMRNPRTDAQVRHRQLFKQQVQLAARMRWAVNTCLTSQARELGMTAYNLFVSLNQPCFGQEEGQLAVDWARLRLSTGPVAPVAFGTPVWTADNVLEVSFERNPLHLRADSTDSVYLYVYVPTLEQGYLAAPVYRAARRVAVSLPDAFAGHEAHLYGMVQNERGQWSETLYIGATTFTETNETVEETEFLSIGANVVPTPSAAAMAVDTARTGAAERQASPPAG